MCGGGAEQIPITPLEEELTQIAAERFARYENVFVPIEDKAIADIVDTTDEKKQARGLANVDTAVAFAKQQEAVQNASAMQRGLGSGGSTVDMAKFGLATEASTGKGLAQADTVTESMRLNNIMAMTDRGMGTAGNAVQGLGNAAEASQARAIADVEAEVAARNAMRSALGTVAGLGYQGYLKGQQLPVEGLAQAQSDWASMTGNTDFAEVGSTGLERGWADGLFAPQ